MNPRRLPFSPCRRGRARFWVLWMAALAMAATCAKADYLDDIGYTRLKLELGAAMFTGSGVTVSQVEASVDLNYAPDTANVEFTGKTFALQSGTTGVSSHATTVAQFLYGANSGIAPGVTTIDLYQADHWLQGGLLNTGVGGNDTPKTESRDVANFSWIGTSGSDATDAEILRRFDYTIQQSNYVAVVGTNNGAGNALPPLLAQNYNGLTVGLSDGDHASGLTGLDAPGRVKPDLVAPLQATSFATPLVAGAAAGLIQTARSTAALANGADSRSVKAILLAGATKTEFPTWSRTTTSPLDSRYGDGELNVYNSYHILTAGEQGPSASSVVGTQGWDFGTATPAGNRLYFFDVPAGMTLQQFTVALTWNRLLTDTQPGPAFVPGAFLDNLDLKLYSATGFTLGTLVDASLSTVENVENLYEPAGLAGGRYAIEVVPGTAQTDYALAWTGTLSVVPEGSTVWLLLAGAGGLGLTRQRRWRARAGIL